MRYIETVSRQFGIDSLIFAVLDFGLFLYYTYLTKVTLSRQLEKIQGPIKICLKLYNILLFLLTLGNIWGLFMANSYQKSIKAAFA